MVARASGTVHRVGTGDTGKDVPRLHLASKPPKDHRSVADSLDYLGDVLGLRDEFFTREEEYRTRLAARKAGDPEIEPPDPWYSIKRTPGKVKLVIRLPDGSAFGAEGKHTKAAVAAWVKRWGNVIASGDALGTKASKTAATAMKSLAAIAAGQQVTDDDDEGGGE